MAYKMKWCARCGHRRLSGDFTLVRDVGQWWCSGCIELYDPTVDYTRTERLTPGYYFSSLDERRIDRLERVV